MSEHLIAGIVRIITPDGSTVGTGFVATDEGLIATCAHVVEAAGVGPGDRVTVVFHAANEVREARVEPDWWRDPDAEDVAMLRLEEPLPEGVTPLLLGSSRGTSGHPFKTFGFPAVKGVEGMWGYGTIGDPTTEAGRTVLQLTGTTEVTPGFSGAPVLDTVTRRVVGMVTAITVPDRYGRLAETAFITPTETLRAVCPALVVSDVCPYRSLDAFTEADADFFFGRQRAVERFLESLRREPRFLAMLGPSGSGKSSLVQAGLIPQLRQGAVPGSDRWGVIVTRPADQPFGQLEAQGLTGAFDGLVRAVQAWLDCHPEQARLVLIVDQFEELLVACPEELRRAFTTQLTGLLEASLPITVVLVMRDDFYSRFAREATDLLSWLERGLVNVPLTLARDELRAIVEKPAKAVGLTFETGLVEAILEDAVETAPEGEGRVGRSTVLPLLEFALTQLWERRRDGALTHDAYGAIGGVTGGLTQWADRAFYGLEEEQQWLARRILTDLVHLGDESQGLPDSRRRRPLNVLCRHEKERKAIHGVVRLLADARLLVTGRDLRSGQETVELIHDALLQQWGHLKHWTAEQREFYLWRQRLDERLQEWEEKEQDEGALLRGALLVEAERWLVERPDDLNPDERDYIRESAALREREEQRWVKAEHQRQSAKAQQLATQAELALDDKARGQVRSLLLAVKSLRRLPTLKGKQSLRRGIQSLPRSVTNIAHKSPVHAVALSFDGKRLATGCHDGIAYLWNVTTGHIVVQLEHNAPVMTVAIVSNGQCLATRTSKGIACVWEIATQREVYRISCEERTITTEFSPDGHWLAIVGRDRTVRLWDVAAGEEVPWIAHKGKFSTVTFSPDGEWLAAGGGADTIWVWEVATGREVLRMPGDNSWADVGFVAFSPDGSKIAARSAMGMVGLWDVSTGQKVSRRSFDGNVLAIAFDLDGRCLVLEDDRGVVYLRKIGDWQERTIKMERDMTLATFSFDGKWLATRNRGNEVLLWETVAGPEMVEMAHGDVVFGIVFGPDGRWLATKSRGEKAWLWETVTGRKVAQVAHDDKVIALAFSPDGNWLATSSYDRSARLWEIPTGRETARMMHEDGVSDVAFSPDGKWLVTAGQNTVQIWEVATKREVTRVDLESSVKAMALSPDARWLAISTDDHTVRILDIGTGREMATMVHEAARGLELVTFSPDGCWLATAPSEGVAWIWDVATGQKAARVAHDVGVWTMTFDLDSKWLATTGLCDCTARVWETATGREVARVEHTDRVIDVAFSPDGKWLAAASQDGTARVYEIATGREVDRMQHEGGAEVVVFSPDGKWLATGGDDGIARVWLWRPEDLIAEACARLPRNLTREEWRQYIGQDEPYRPTCPSLPVPGE